MPLIEINKLTKDYGDGRGIFDLSLSIEEGEVYGFVGTNGAGKTTTIRHLMGFLQPQSGSARIHGLDCWKDAAEIKKLVAYIPGAIAFPDAPTGYAFLKRQADLLQLKDLTYMEEIIEKLQLDPTANLKRMSKGMKQKTAIAAAFMADPEILILDEPTTGLDPLMRAEFVDLLNAEKKKGKTIFMSSHMFEELEDTCDKVALIKDGRIIDVKSTLEIKHNQDKVYKIEFASQEEYSRFLSEEAFTFEETREEKNQVLVCVHDKDINLLIQTLTGYAVQFITEIKYTLEDYFRTLY
ncbi:MAG: ATP-binding cassette domain-containing protein [Clostridiales bacterium]|nr:ATP-binding cassette domain-containing protein [Clostridiales bacterium]